MAKIGHTLNKAQAEEIFAANAVFMSNREVIFDYKIVALFGAEVCKWAERCMYQDGYLRPGEDFNSWGDFRINYFTKSGYCKLVSQHNCNICFGEYVTSDGGRLWDDLRSARKERLAEREAEEERKKQERKAKRETARKAKEEFRNDL